MAALISLPTSALLVLLSFLVSFNVCSISCAVGPLDPWIVPNATMPWITDSSLPGHHCINIKTSIYGLCSNLNHVWWAITMARSLSAHEIAIYLDHKDNFYQCFENRSITAFFEPGKECLRTDSAPAGCVAVGVYDSWSMDAFTKEFGEALFFGHSSGVRSRHDASSSSTNSSRALEYMSHNLAHEAAVEERCQTLRCWWNLTPELQALVTQARADISALSGQRHWRRPMVAIQARGGDKAADEVLAGDVLDPKTHQYAMGYGIKRLKLAHPGLEGPTCIIVGDADGSYVSSLIHQANDILNCSSVVVRTGGKGPWGLVGHQGLRPNATAGRGPQGHHQSSFNGLPLEQRCNATKQFIVDLEVMGWADFLVSNEKSNVAEVAYLLRYLPDIKAMQVRTSEGVDH